MITLFQHGKDEGPGLIESILTGRGDSYEIMHLYETNEVTFTDCTHLVILGGIMSVHDEREYPFLREEKKIIRDFISAGRPVLGICLGAQLIAAAMGARVFPSGEEKGWYPVHQTDGCFDSLPTTFTVFQWHNETFDLPAGAHLICTGDLVRHQMFSTGTGLGVQFHMEVTADIIDRWTEHEPSQDEIRRKSTRFLGRSVLCCSIITGHFLGHGVKIRG